MENVYVRPQVVDQNLHAAGATNRCRSLILRPDGVAQEHVGDRQHVRYPAQ
jgi:hypothetical protein